MLTCLHKPRRNGIFLSRIWSASHTQKCLVCVPPYLGVSMHAQTLVFLFLAKAKAELYIRIDSMLTSEEAQAGMNEGLFKVN